MPMTKAQLEESLLKLDKRSLLDDHNLKGAFEIVIAHIYTNEEIEYVFNSHNIPNTYLLTATNRRLLIISKPMTQKEHEFELSYKNILKVIAKKSFFIPKIIIITKDDRTYKFSSHDYNDCIAFSKFMKNKVQYLL